MKTVFTKQYFDKKYQIIRVIETHNNDAPNTSE